MLAKSARPLLVIALASGVAASSVHAETFTPAHVAKLRSAQGAQMSPDGRYIAYKLSVPRKPFVDDNGPAYGELHVVDTDGNTRPFITGAVSIGGVQWTPDSKAITFGAKRGKDKNRSLYLLPIDGGEARKILSHETDIGSYSWHPDGKSIAFVATDKKDKKRKKREDKGFNAEVVEEQYRNKNVWIAPVSNYSYDVNAKDVGKPKKIDKLKGTVTRVTFSPTAQHLVVEVAPTPSIDDHYMRRKLVVIDAKKHRVVTRFDTPGKLGHARWSPDGRRLAFVSALDANDPREGRIAIGTIGKPKVQMLLGDYQGMVESVTWKDAETLLYLASEGVWSVLGTIKADGTKNQLLIPSGKQVLSGLSASKDARRIALTGQSAQHPSEVFLFSTAGRSKAKRLTNSNPWLSKMAFAKQEVVRFKAKDGLDVEGILIHPLKPRKYAPLIVAVHGGPESHMRNGWLTYYSYPGQIAAAEGFAVFYPNYRGSTGRGVKFSKMGQADYAGKEIDDIIDGIDHLAAKGLINKKKVGVTGGSYGGFASAWMATYHTKRFAASVMFVGISDQVSKFGTTDIPNEMFLVHSRKWPWRDWSFFRERSPITYVEQARTPILIMHGKNDTRVHPTQSMELFRYLKTIGKTPVRLVMYPGEGHGNRKSASRLDYNLRMLRWMKHYLKGKGGKPPPESLDYAGFEPKKDKDDK